jgi:plastocyanin
MKALLIGLTMLGVIKSASAMNHGGMLMDEKGMIMNANSDNLPRDCTKISENVDITIHAGHKHALKFTGKMFAFDQQEWKVKPCAKINITFINDDQIRHQLMIHGLPGYLYPEGMFHLELYGEGQLQASLIMPSQKKTYLVHCELPQHMEKGMKAQIKVDGGDGDLPSIPGISKPVRADVYPVDWSRLSTAVLLLCVLAGCAIPFFIIINAQNIKNMIQKIFTKLNFKRKQNDID